jgi:hypothetical protein
MPVIPKGFQRVRYYGLQATATFKKWYEVIARVFDLLAPPDG